MICPRLGLPGGDVDMAPWRRPAVNVESDRAVRIAAVGDYSGAADCCKSANEAPLKRGDDGSAFV